MAMTEVPTNRFAYECSRLIDAHRQRQDPIVVMMAQRATGNIHIPPDSRTKNKRNGRFSDTK